MKGKVLDINNDCECVFKGIKKRKNNYGELVLICSRCKKEIGGATTTLDIKIGTTRS